ncbi:ATP-binding protein [Endothiovibrio diazotrophicus]
MNRDPESPHRHDDAQRFQTLFQAMNEGVALHELVFDEQGRATDYRILEVNPAYSAILGLSKEAVEGELASAIYGQTPPPYLEIFREVGLSGRGTRFESRYEPMARHFDISVFSPGPNQFATIFTDITERRDTEESLRHALGDLERERGFLKSLIRTVPDLVWLKDGEGRYLACNSEFERYFGAAEEEIVGKTDYDFVDRSQADSFREHDLKAIAHGGPSTNEEWITYASDGRHLLMETTKTPMRDARGQVIGVLGIAHDITGQRESEQALTESRNRAESANRAKSEFLATMSHEIRTPMNVVVGLGDLLLESNLDDEQRAHLHRLQQASNTLLELIDSILDLSAVEAGRASLREEPVELARIVEETVGMMGVVAENKGLRLERHVDPVHHSWVRGDERRLRQVLVNLIGNAVKFTERGRVTVTLEADRRSRPEILRLSVSDTGIGIGPDHLERIFEKFTQVDTGYARRYGGTGLGLAITRQLIERMDGRIHVESRLDHGSTFHIELPLLSAPPVAAPFPAAIPEEEPERARQPQAALRILMAEDSEDNTLLIQTYLKGTPHHLEVVGDGEAAVRRAASERFDLILMDIQMPLMDGYQATRAIREAERGGGHSPTVILALTAHALDGDARKSLEAGCDGHLTKPIKKAQLLAAIDTHTGHEAKQKPRNAGLTNTK